MSDEQTIYISPEDDLTTVRERLEKISSRHVTLVIPSQTQLRSHVAWKLLYARARELGKEVLIVSSDPQVRAVAHAVKFAVAYSLESPQPGKRRQGSRPARSASGRAKSPATAPRTPRGLIEPRSARPRQQQSGPTQWYPSTTEQPDFLGSTSRRRGNETVRDADTPFDIPEQHDDQPYEFRVNTVPPMTSAPPIRAITPEQIEEPDLLFEDYTQAQDIRHAATSGTLPPTGQVETPSDNDPSYKKMPLPTISDDPFAYMADPQPPPAAEQLGAVSIERFDTNEHAVQDVAESPTSVIDGEIEYQGDKDDIVPPLNNIPITHAWVENAPDDEPEEDGPRRVHGLRPRTRRTVPPAQNRAPRPRQDDAEPQIEERTTQIRPARPSAPLPARPSAPLAARPSAPLPARPSVPLTAARAERERPSAPLPPVPQKRGPTQAPAAPRRPAPAPASTRPGQQRSAPRRVTTNNTRRAPNISGRGGNRRLITILVAAICLLLLGILVYFGPSTSVKITVAARDYAHTVQLTASTKQTPDTVPATLMSKNFVVSGTENATGHKMVDKGVANGYVCFNNNGDSPVDIPSMINVATANNVQFQLQADVVMDSHYTCNPDDPYKIPVKAVKPGESGNVPAGSITIIPDESLNAIAAHNNVAANTLKLTVSNEHATTGGGVQPIPSVVQADLDRTKTDLHKKLQGNIDTWLKGISTHGITGPVDAPDVLATGPKVNDIVESGQFPATLTIHATALFVSDSDLQKAAVGQLNKSLSIDKAYTNFVINTDTNKPVNIEQVQTKRTGATAMTLSFNAMARAVPAIDKESLKSWISGKSIGDARSVLMTNNTSIQNVEIHTSPGLISWVAYWPGHIDVAIQPHVSPTTPKK